MPNDSLKRYKLQFPHGEHEDCRALTELTAEHLPPDGSLGRLRRYRPKSDVWQPDDRADRIYFLLRGRVVISAGSADGGEVTVSVVEPGQPFGELCFCGGPTEYRRTTAGAESESEAREIKVGDFVDYVRANREVFAAVLFTFCIRLGEVEKRLALFAYRNAGERLGRLLLHLAASAKARRPSQAKTDDGKVTLAVTHEELARMAVMSRQRVTITMGELRRRGLVGYGRNQPLVVNVPALADYLADDLTN
jgi:CRP-like cAMP-binding protein